LVIYLNRDDHIGSKSILREIDGTVAASQEQKSEFESPGLRLVGGLRIERRTGAFGTQRQIGAVGALRLQAKSMCDERPTREKT